MSLELKRYTGETIGDFGEELNVACDWPECTKSAVFLPCNAEGDKGRAHHHGGVHRLSGQRGRWFCETHGLKVLKENDDAIYLRRQQAL